jgi:hypothetical protein
MIELRNTTKSPSRIGFQEPNRNKLRLQALRVRNYPTKFNLHVSPWRTETDAQNAMAISSLQKSTKATKDMGE